MSLRDGSRARAHGETGREGRSRRREEATERARRIEHQSSIRSLLSLSDAETMEEEIQRQILEEGLLDGIDLDNLGPTQEDELSERIAEAYRRRHGRSRSQRRDMRDHRAPESRSRADSRSFRRTSSTPLPGESVGDSSGSRLLEPSGSNDQTGRRRRLSDQGNTRRRPSPVRTNPASSSDDALRPAPRTTSDMTYERPRTSTSGRERPADLSETRSRRGMQSDQDLSMRREPRLRRDVQSTQSSTSANASPLSDTQPNPLSSAAASTLAPRLRNTTSRPSSSRSTGQRTTAYVEPLISCDRCGNANIQYDLHKHCSRCNDGKYDICMRCYRLGRGCLRWPGFGVSAQAYFDRIVALSRGEPAPPRETPHILLFRRYQRPDTAVAGNQRTTDDPTRRLQTGFFCDICESPANECFWKCNECNEGDWGYCNGCVNQGRCCTHSLLPICRTNSTRDMSTPTRPTQPENAFKILSFSTKCDICTYPIPASTTRFHCLKCTQGDYDVCTNCYLKLVATGKISKENGNNGWRRCLRGHRMVIVGFEDHEEGQRRVVVRDLVGGRALKDEHVQPTPTINTTSTASPGTASGDWSWKEGSERRKKSSRVRTSSTSASAAGNTTNTTTNINTNSEDASSISSQPSFPRYPPDGGVGLIVRALWSWYPEDGVTDELSFPRGAEITEAENINDDWFWGCYAGSTGLFPGSHGVVVGEVV